MTKRSLITISHAIEQAAITSQATRDEPVVLIAMFQRPLYFDRERASYRQLSRATTLTVVGVVDPEPDVPPGVEGIAVDPDEPLAAEWSVVMLTPRAGAALVAVDQERIVPGETSVETGRVFQGWYSFHRRDAETEVDRLRQVFGDRLSHRALTIIDDVLDEADNRRSSSAEDRTAAAVQLFVSALEKSERRVRELRALTEPGGPSSQRDPLTGLPNRAFLRSWIGSGAHTASGTLPVALVLLDVNRLRDVNEWFGRNVGDDVLRGVAEVLSLPLRETDHAVRLDDDEFLVILPGLSLDQATRMAYRLCADIATMRRPSLDPRSGVTAFAAVMTTRERPLPVEELHQALRRGKDEGLSVSIVPSPGEGSSTSRALVPEAAAGDGAPQGATGQDGARRDGAHQDGAALATSVPATSVPATSVPATWSPVVSGATPGALTSEALTSEAPPPEVLTPQAPSPEALTSEVPVAAVAASEVPISVSAVPLGADPGSLGPGGRVLGPPTVVRPPQP
ncbi:diguanylate cyclase domain-containing protein [Quadrisphaera sp. DSM 44207]|uniref:sensor domain-containing diguanylate cyclase n=1 Tax=Quadrisphaera sp. DSM 44207 TaxID=1881057 RepID=UPI0015A0C99C|nr:diguanylate cyclase [Quadrisphaera sp. DSM 44207]